MSEEIRKLLEEELKEQIKEFRDLPVGTKERESAAENVAKLCRLLIEDQKNEWDYGFKFDAQEFEHKEKKIEAEEQKKSQKKRMIFDACIKAVEVVTFLLAFTRGLEFEEKGSIVSPWMRALINAIVPKFFRK